MNRRTVVTLLAAAALVVSGVVSVGNAPATADQSEGSSSALVDTHRLITAGGLHTCAVMDEGSVRCWGANDNGQLGNGTRAVSPAARLVTGISDAVAVTAGNTHTCALLADSTVRCWGLNSNGQIGLQPTMMSSSDVPVAVPGLAAVRSIAAGGFHNCAVLFDGAVKCWGHDGSGQLGDGDGTPLGDAFVPVDVVGISNAVAVAAGEFHSCALLATGGVRCWGDNGFGQLGTGTTTRSAAPVDVAGLPDTSDADNPKKAKAIAAGYGHTCAVVDDGDEAEARDTARCWGSNNQGQVGDRTRTDRTTPVKVQIKKDGTGAPMFPPYEYETETMEGVLAVTAGQQHSCALIVGGKARCWGNAARGQIGDGTTGDDNPALKALPEDSEYQPLRQMWPIARLVSGGGFTAVTAGGYHTCGLHGTALQCWGYNFYGQLGSYAWSSGAPVTVTALQGAASVTAGTDFACARVTVPGTPDTHQPVCWGNNNNGELGAGAAAGSTSAVPVDVASLPDVSTIEAGNGHACALPTGSTTPRCWGRNGDGQVGDGTTTNAAVPVPVSGLAAGVTALSTGGRHFSGEIGHSCAALSSGMAQCWGDNQRGQLGDGTQTDSTTPVTVLYDSDPAPPDPVTGDDHVDPAPLSGITSVVTGGSHSCALRDASGETQVWCWGQNAHGQLGDHTTTLRTLAVQVKLEDNDEASGEQDVYLTGVSHLAAGERHTCAVMTGEGPGDDTAGQVRCWGDNGEGQLGDGTVAGKVRPTRIPTIPNMAAGDAHNPPAVRLTAGDRHTCAIMANASARCWGDNGDGQLGTGSVGGRSTSPVTPVGLNNETADTIRSALAAVEDPPPGMVKDLVTSLSASRRNTCASLIDMTVSCWGSNSSGQLGDGLGPTRKTPIDVLHLAEGVAGNHSPVAADDATSTSEDTSTTVAVSGNDTDVDAGDALVINFVTDPPHGTATASGGTITYTPDADHCGSDSFAYQVFDGKNGVAWANVSVAVSCVNDAPVATDDAVSTPEDVTAIFAVLANDTDPDGDTLTILAITQPEHGTAQVAGGAVEYTPAVDHTGPDSFTYVVTDGVVSSASATVSITVTAVNDPPVALDDLASTGEDTAVVVAVLANDSDVDADTLSVASVTQPAHGSAAIVSGGVRYTPAPDFHGTDSFSYIASDGHGGTATAAVSVNVTPVNDAPRAVDDSASTTDGVAVVVPVLGNDSDVDGDTLSVASVAQPLHGTTEIASGGVRYAPSPGYTGPDSFTYVVRDPSGATAQATVSVTVGPANYAPFARDDLASTAEDAAVTIAVLTNDFDPDGDALTITAVTPGGKGTAEIVSGAVRYTPAADFWGTDSFTYTVSDGRGGTAAAAVSVSVSPVNDAPVANDDAVSVAEDTSTVLHVTGNDTDADRDVLTITAVTQPAHGAAAIDGGSVRYTPVSNYNGTDSFSYTISDGNGGSATATVTVTVTAVNDPPTLDPIPNQTASWGTEVTAHAVGSDIDGNPLTYSLATNFGTISLDGTFTWTPGSADIGVRTVTVRVSDGAASATRSFEVTVTRRATAIAYTGATSGQHSDPATLSARVTTTDGSDVDGVTVAFTLAGKQASGQTTSGAASASIVLNGPPATATATAAFGGDAAYEPSSTSAAFTVTPEDALVTFTGQHLVQTTATGAAATLSATVQEVGDSSPSSSLGDAQVRFTDIAGTLLCSATVATSSPGSGTGSCTTASLPLGSRAVVVKLVAATHTAPVEVAAFSVAAVPTGSAAGGGAIVVNGQRADFAFRAVPGKKGSPPSGDAIQVFRQLADLGGGERSYAFVVSSSSLSSLTTACTGKATKVCSATVEGATTTVAVDLATGTVKSVTGVGSIRIDATDAAEPSAGELPSDRYAVSVQGPSPYSAGTATDQRVITAGNIRIPV